MTKSRNLRKPSYGRFDRLTFPAEYRAWTSMRERCNQPCHPVYDRYGGRGIAVCERWDEFPSFLQDMGRRPEGMSLDRIDNDGDYEPSNCRWASATTQANNRRSNRIVEINGENKTVEEWSRLLGINSGKVRRRLSTGWTVERAFDQI